MGLPLVRTSSNSNAVAANVLGELQDPLNELELMPLDFSVLAESSNDSSGDGSSTASDRNASSCPTASSPQHQPVRLSEEERAEKIRRYREKKNKRKWNKEVHYQSRKRVADTRPRFKGRFVSEEKAAHLYEEYYKEMVIRHKTERHFAVSKVCRRTGKVLSSKFPNRELMERNIKRTL